MITAGPTALSPEIDASLMKLKAADPRRAVWKGPSRRDEVDLRALKAPLPPYPSCKAVPAKSDAVLELVGKVCAAHSCPPCIQGIWCLSTTSTKAKGNKNRIEQAPPKWFRVHQLNDTCYFVRPDAGLRGRIPGISSQIKEKGNQDDVKKEFVSLQDSPFAAALSLKKLRRRSLPPKIERRLGLPFVFDTFATLSPMDNLCTICYEAPSSVVILPCRHGTMCEPCLRRSMFSRPAHRGGRNCPHCRRPIREVVKMYHDGYCGMYGYALNMDRWS